MEKILPVAGATGAHSYAATEADPPSLTGDQDQESDHASLQAPGNDLMDIDSVGQPSISTSSSSTSADILLQPATKRPHVDDDSISVARHASSKNSQLFL